MRTEEHESFLRETFRLAEVAAREGDEPFAALIVADGKVLLSAANRVKSDRDRTRHSELIIVSEAMQHADEGVLEGATLYASTEPCAMCAGAIYWSRISRVVYGCSQAVLAELTGCGFSIPCRDILNAGTRRIEVIGPLLEEEARLIHERHWHK